MPEEMTSAQKLAQGQMVLIRPEGRSMRPFLTAGKDAVLVQKRTPKKYDIALYRRADGRLILHRILRKTADGYICCGDRSAECEAVAPEQILGVVIQIARRGKLISADRFAYKLWALVWCIMPLRRLVLHIYGKSLKK